MKGAGLLRSRVSIKLPSGKHEAMPVLNPLDESDLIAYALKNSICFFNNISDFDFVAVPYAIRKRDIQHVRDVLGPQGAHI